MFKFENCLLKHHIRVNGWLPLCKQRLQTIQQNGHSRRLRYFTFCAVGAIDVLMLDVEKVIRQSIHNKFDTVFFFDVDPESVTETQKRIPGAIGFPADFVSIALKMDASIRQEESEIVLGDTGPDTFENRDIDRQKLIVNQFKRHFPFDVINLDLEEFLFKPSDPYPGKVLNALRNTFSCQTQPLVVNKRSEYLDGFTLMFTTRIGPFDLPSEYLGLLASTISGNLRNQPMLADILGTKAGTQDAQILKGTNFDLFFKLAVPKVIAAALLDTDWYVSPGHGIKVFEFERRNASGTYKILHFAMDVKRQNPPKGKRAPLEPCQEAITAYNSVCLKLFKDDSVIVSESSIDSVRLQAHLDRIKARRRKYFPDEQP